MTEQAGMKVLTVKAGSNSDADKIIPAAEYVCKRIRQLYWNGYDLRHLHFEITAHLVLNNRPIKPALDLRLCSGELRERSKRK